MQTSYKANVAKLLAQTLSTLSMDLIQMISAYVTCPTATAGAIPQQLWSRGDGQCWDVACGPDNRLWVTSSIKVNVLDADGQFLHDVFSSEGLWWDDAAGIAVCSSGEAYISDYRAQCIRVCRSDGSFERQFGWQRGGEDRQFRNPLFLAVDSQQGLLFVSEGIGPCVQVVRLDGTFVRMIGNRPESDDAQFAYHGIAVNEVTKEVCVSDRRAMGPLQVFDYEGQFLRSCGKETKGCYAGLAVDSVGNWIAADVANSCVQVFTAKGDPITAFGHLERPLGVCVDLEGHILVVSKGQVHVFAFQDG